MTDIQEQAEPQVLAHGRFKLSQTPAGDLVAAAATGICDRCQSCGCGEQAEPRVIPAVMVKLLKGKLLKGVLGGHGPDA